MPVADVQVRLFSASAFLLKILSKREVLEAIDFSFISNHACVVILVLGRE